MSFDPTRYRFGLFEVDVPAGSLLKQGHTVRLQEQPFRVLVALLERHGDVVTRDDLRARLWPGDTFVEFDKSLGVALTKVRAALGDDAGNPRFIETLPRRGYRFIAPVAVEVAQHGVPPATAPVGEASGSDAIATPAPVPSRHDVGRRPARRWGFVAVAALVLTGLAVFALYRRRAPAAPATGRV